MKKFKRFLLNLSEVNNKKKKGFTLIELIAVIAILGILALVLIPNVTAYTNKAKVAKAVTDAGLICRAVDAYEAETADNPTGATLVVAADTEASETLSSITTGTAIIGVSQTVATLPNEFMSTVGKDLSIEKVRKIANKTLTPTFDSKGQISAVN